MIDPAQLQDLAKQVGADLSLEGARALLRYLDAMLEENRRINLTAVRDREAAVLLHALDSVALGAVRFEQAPRAALDLGTGNGFPGVAIACLFPSARVVLVDRTLKKLRAISRALEQAGFEAGRFETVQMDAAEAHAHGYRSSFDLVATRAVGPPPEMGRLAHPLLTPHGSLVTWLSDESEAPRTLRGGLRKLAEHRYTLPTPTERQRRLVRYGYERDAE